MWEKIEMKQFKILAIGVIVISFLSSGIFAFYNHSQGQNKETYDLEKLLVEARSLYYQGDYQASIDRYQEVLEHEANQKARRNLAAIYEELGDYDKAVKEYSKLLKEEEKPKVRLDLGIAYYNLNKLDKARKELSKVIDSEIKDDYLLRDANYYLSLIAYKKEKYSQAEDYIEAALNQDKFALGYYQLGEIEFAQGNYQVAIDSYRQALRTDGSLKGVNRKLGLAYLKLDQIKQAVSYLKRANSENSQDELVTEKLVKLEEDYPDYFKIPDRTLPEERKKEIPKQVSFKDIDPIEKSGRSLRIGIMDDEQEVYFRVGSQFIVKVGDKVVAEGQKGEVVHATLTAGKYQLKVGEREIEFKEPIRIIPKIYAPVLVHNVIYGKGYYWGGVEDRQYRGSLELIPRKKGITVVNLVDMEEYLMAVIPSEMSASWPLEALKVQAVAARSYTLANLGKHQADGYDLCSTVHCAAYRGLTREYSNSNQAVLETAGEVMTYDGKAINAVYSANSGGHTENSEDVWNFEVPYLKAVSTEKEATEFPLEPVELKEWLKEVPTSYSNQSKYTKLSHYRWQRDLSIDYLEARLGIKDIKQIIPTGRGKAGSVKSLLVVGAEEEKEFRYSLRSRFGGLRSNRFWIQPQYEDGKLVSFLFHGSGWGHSVGMDQVAVAGMADADYKYKEILNHFYSNITIEDRY